MVVLVVIGLTGCTAGSQPGLKSKPPVSAMALAGEPGSDLGNGRSAVTFDGLIVALLEGGTVDDAGKLIDLTSSLGGYDTSVKTVNFVSTRPAHC